MPHTVVFNPAKLSYQAADVNSADDAGEISVVLSDRYYQLTSITMQLVDNVSGDNVTSITFNPKGKPSASGTIILHRGPRSITIEIDKNGKIEQINP